MPFDFMETYRADIGRENYFNGLAAEDCVAREIRAIGGTILEERWRSEAGEVDLIYRDVSGVVFVEVKRATTFEEAAERLTSGQIARVSAAAELYLEQLGEGGSTPVRIDGALVDGCGRVQFLENISIL